MKEEYAPWVEVKKRWPWRWFFTYHEMHCQSGTIRHQRLNRLDGVFNWICVRLSRFNRT